MRRNGASNKVLLAINGTPQLRIKVQPAQRNARYVVAGQVDVFLDFYEQMRDAAFYYSRDSIDYIGYNFRSISWHSFAVKKDGDISRPKVHFKDGSRRVCVDSHGYVQAREIIAYPVVSLIVHTWNLPRACRHGHQRKGLHPALNFDTEPPFCLDLFVLPAGIALRRFFQEYDASLFLAIASNTVFMPAFDGLLEPCGYRGSRFGRFESADVNGWTLVARLTDPPAFSTASGLSKRMVFSYDLRIAATSLLDRPICYPTDDPEVLEKTTSRERLNDNPSYEKWYRNPVGRRR